MRTVALMLCFALAGCSGMSAVTESTPSAGEAPPTGMGPAAAEQAAPAAPPPATAAPQRRAPQALRGTSAPPTPPRASGAARHVGASNAPPQAEPAMSTEEQVLAIRQGCWSAADKNRALKGLDARADWVSKCIADKTKEVGQ